MKEVKKKTSHPKVHILYDSVYIHFEDVLTNAEQLKTEQELPTDKVSSEGWEWRTTVECYEQENVGVEGHYLDFSDGFTGVYICKNWTSCTCYTCTVYCRYVNFTSIKLLKIKEKNVKHILTAYWTNIFMIKFRTGF